MKRFASLSFSILSLTGCVATDADATALCVAAAEHIDSCLGPSRGVPADCRAEDAMPILALGCDELGARVDSAKADGFCPSWLAWTGLCDAPMPEDFNDGARRAVDHAALESLVGKLRFGPMTRRRLLAACPAPEPA